MAIVTSPSVVTPVEYHLNGAAPPETNADSEVEIRGQLMTITPAMAADLLKRRLPNRPLSKARVRTMIDDMRAGRWETNGEAIILSDDLSVLDGQHRLQAVVESGVAIEAFVVIGVSPDTMLSIDQGARRNGTQILQMHELPHAPTLAATARWLWRFEHSSMRSRACGLRDTALPAYLTARPSLVAALPMGRAVRDLLPTSVGAMLAHVTAQKDAAQATQYFDDLAHGSNLKPDAPAHVVREKLLRDKSPKTHLAVVNRGALLVLGWACLRHGRYLSSAVSWKGVSDPAIAFPAIV